ncbi:amino acid ABC transporter substrate-binding protein [Synechocystis salina LEGE 06155]|nr:amino acid ABC transporter substrate-binding protein [Synechocystis salina LEGE 06155]
MKKFACLALSVLLSGAVGLPSWAGEVLDRIEQTGVINAGTRKDAVPFAYVNEQGQWVGFSIDMLELIRRETEARLGKPIKLNMVEATADNRFDLIKDQTIDLECASSTFTWNRTAMVDFSVSYFADGTKIITRVDSDLESANSLAGRAIGVIPDTTNEKAILNFQPGATIVEVKDQADGMARLEAGEIEAFAGDGIVLAGLKKTSNNPQQWKVVPNFPYQYEAYACLLPKDDSDWRNLVNYSLLKYMEGIISDQRTAVEIYERWFDEETGVAPYPRETINDYYQGIVDSFEWIPIIGY